MSPNKRTIKDYFIISTKGFCMGIADVIPGVSGGTMAFILGIYEELISSIKSFDISFAKYLLTFKIKDALKHCPWQFVSALMLGILTAIFSLAKVISWMLDNYPVLIWSFFFGLIIASVVTISMHLRKVNAATFTAIMIGALGAFYIVGMVPVSTPESPWFIFISGVIAICAMILPGISGSFILVLLGKYQHILNAVNSRDFLTLFIFAVGAGVGLTSFARLLNWLFRKYHDLTIAGLIGVLIGSLRKIWPWKQILQTTVDRHGKIVPFIQQNIMPQQWDQDVLMAVILATTGFLTIIGINILAENSEG